MNNNTIPIDADDINNKTKTILSNSTNVKEKESTLAISKIFVQGHPGENQLPHYYIITPEHNDILEICQKLERLEMNSMDVA